MGSDTGGYCDVNGCMYVCVTGGQVRGFVAKIKKNKMAMGQCSKGLRAN